MCAKATHDSTFPVSGSSFSIANLNNEFNSIFQGDISALRPRAKDVPDMTIVIAASESEGYYRQVYTGNDSYSVTTSGVVTFTAPTSNARIDLIHTSGTAGVVTRQGTESASPAIPFMPSGLGYIPICAVYHKTTETKIVDYEDQASNPDEGYIYRDLRPVMATPHPNFVIGTAANNIVQLDSSAKLPAVDGSQLTNLSTSAIGTWLARSIDTEYTATTDGFIVGSIYFPSTGSDSASAWASIQSPTGTVRQYVGASPLNYGEANYRIGIMCPIKKGDTWKVVTSINNGSVEYLFWLPLGI